ncbi:MAG: L-lactate permease [Oscillospiraceae bacterium]|nr:L-lactate permease [Oscillospiraceae bacterium]
MMTVLSLLPIVSLLACLVFFRLSAAKSGWISLVAALVIALFFFGLPLTGLSAAVGKAGWLTLFISLIVWGALFLYHLVSDFGAVDVINRNITAFVQDGFAQTILLSWLFSGLLQGMAGFGVPPVIVTPILISLGLHPIKSLAAAIIGHSWAVSFGSMGSAFFVIAGLTNIPTEQLAPAMWIFGAAAILLTGLAVCFIHSGLAGVVKGIAYILPVSAVMAAVQYLAIYAGVYSLVSIITALSGIAAMLVLYKLRHYKEERRSELRHGDLSLIGAVLPYISIVVLAAVFAFLPIKFFRHPAPLLLFASTVAVMVYKRAGIWDSGVFRGSVSKTVKKGTAVSIALLALSNMSLVMTESGMTHRLADDTARLTGGLYPLFAPFFGVLGSFLTGSNTSSNLLFGTFQYEIASRLEINTTLMVAVQSISGSVGVSIGPTLVLMGAIAANQKGKESQILKKLIPIVMLIALVMGVINYIIG